MQRSIEILETTHKDEIGRPPGPYDEGWIWTSRGRKELRRIPYLARIRNQVMEKLKQLAESSNGQKGQTFDKILWLNDAPSAYMNLLSHNVLMRIPIFRPNTLPI